MEKEVARNDSFTDSVDQDQTALMCSLILDLHSPIIVYFFHKNEFEITIFGLGLLPGKVSLNKSNSLRLIKAPVAHPCSTQQ